MATHMQLDTAQQVFYHFQPKGLNPKTGEPVDSYLVDPARLIDGEYVEDFIDLPISVLGTEVEDKASGFKGTAIALIYHINGCVHFDVQPKGTLKETGSSIRQVNFDIRRLTGKAIKKLSEPELEKSKKEKPSPAPTSSYRPGFA